MISHRKTQSGNFFYFLENFGLKSKRRFGQGLLDGGPCKVFHHQAPYKEASSRAGLDACGYLRVILFLWDAIWINGCSHAEVGRLWGCRPDQAYDVRGIFTFLNG